MTSHTKLYIVYTLVAEPRGARISVIDMNYLDAKLELQQNGPKIPFSLLAAEASIMVAVATLLVTFLA